MYSRGVKGKGTPDVLRLADTPGWSELTGLLFRSLRKLVPRTEALVQPNPFHLLEQNQALPWPGLLLAPTPGISLPGLPQLVGSLMVPGLGAST